MSASTATEMLIFHYDNCTTDNTEMIYDGKNRTNSLSKTAFSIIICVLILCGNSLVLVSVTRFSTLRTPTNMFLCAFALSDLMVGIIIIPGVIETFRVNESFELSYKICILLFCIRRLPIISTNYW